jgi:FkbM family methyltransferase
MEGLQISTALTSMVARQRLLQNDAFALLDIGCSHGISAAWREFEPDLTAHAVDPMADECQRLRQAETNPNVHYHTYFLDLPESHPLVQARGGRYWVGNNPWDRLSVAWALEIVERRKAQLTQQDILTNNRWQKDPSIETTPTITPSEFLQRHQITTLDFIKLDIDGKDYDVLTDLAPHLDRLGVLGVGLEVNFVGTDSETDHTFHNMDRLMRRAGFSLYGLTTRNYSRRALPAPFAGAVIAKTTWGAPLQGDAVYLRDLCLPDNDYHTRLSATKLLKLACLFAKFGLPDCAAEVLVEFAPRLNGCVDVEAALDLLVPEFRGQRLRYREYLALFEADPEAFNLHSASCTAAAPVATAEATPAAETPAAASVPVAEAPAAASVPVAVSSGDPLMPLKRNTLKLAMALGLVVLGIGLGMFGVAALVTLTLLPTLSWSDWRLAVGSVVLPSISLLVIAGGVVTCLLSQRAWQLLNRGVSLRRLFKFQS